MNHAIASRKTLRLSKSLATVILSIILLSNSAQADPKSEAATRYATEAVRQQQQNILLQAGFAGLEWNDDFMTHYNWAMHGANLANTPDHLALREFALQDWILKNQPSEAAKRYGTQSNRQFQESQRLNTGFLPPVWSADTMGHQNWASLPANLPTTSMHLAGRERELQLFVITHGDPSSIATSSDTKHPGKHAGAGEFQPAGEMAMNANVNRLKNALRVNPPSDLQLRLMQRIGIDSPEALRNYQEKTEPLANSLREVASFSEIQAPSAAQLEQWIDTIKQMPENVTPRNKKLMHSVAPKIIESFATPSSLGLPSRPRMIANDDVNKSPFLPMTTPTVVDESETQFRLDPRNRTLYKTFKPSHPGLYRTEFNFYRLGGSVEFHWRVETSSGSPIIQGGDAIHSTTSPDFKTSKFIYFWLTAADIRNSEQCKLHFEVVKNEDYKGSVPVHKPDDGGIEQDSTGHSFPTDATISGSIQVVRQKPIPLAHIGSADVRVNNLPENADMNYPIQYLEMSPYLPEPRPSTIKYPLEFVITPKKNVATKDGGIEEKTAYKGLYVENGTTKQDDGLSWKEIQLIRDDQVVTEGKTTPVYGVTYYKLPNVKAGTYRILLGAFEPRFDVLMQMGIVCPSMSMAQQLDYKGLTRIQVDSTLKGGYEKHCYVAELTRLEVDSQYEPDNDANDVGLGEFKLETNTYLVPFPSQKYDTNAFMPESRIEKQKMDRNPYRWLDEKGMQEERAIFPERKHISMPGRFTPTPSYPNALLSWWDKNHHPGLDRSLSIMSVVIEDDEKTWWQKYGAAIEMAAKSFYGIAKIAYTGNPSGIVSLFKSAIEDGLAASAKIESVDDIPGTGVFYSTGDQGFGLLLPGEPGHRVHRDFTLAGHSNMNLFDMAAVTPVENGRVPALVSQIHSGAKPGVKMDISIREAKAHWVRGLKMQVLSFTLNNDLAWETAEDDGNVFWPTAYTSHGKTILADGLEVMPIGSTTRRPEKMQLTETQQEAVFIENDAKQWRLVPAKYAETSVWLESQYGGQVFAGIASTTLYMDDLLSLAAESRTQAKRIPIGAEALQAAQQQNQALLKNHSHALVYKEGNETIVEYILKDARYHLETLHFKVMMEIWQPAYPVGKVADSMLSKQQQAHLGAAMEPNLSRQLFPAKSQIHFNIRHTTQVTDSPLAGAMVILRNKSGILAQGLTDVHGRYIAGVPGGYYNVEVLKEGYETISLDCKFDQRQIAQSISLKKAALQMIPTPFHVLDASSAHITLKKLVCHDTEDFAGDEIRLIAYQNEKEVGRWERDMNEDDSNSISISEMPINQSFTFNETFTLKLWDRDTLSDDFLGEVEIGAWERQQGRAGFNLDGASYSILFDVKGPPHPMPLLKPEFQATYKLSEFRKRSGKGVFTHPQLSNRQAIANSIELRLKSPENISNRLQPLCGPAAIGYELLRRRPDLFTEWVIQLWETGKGDLIGDSISISNDLKDSQIGGGMEAADWILVASLRDDANLIFDVNEGEWGGNLDASAGFTTHMEMKEFSHSCLNAWGTNIEFCAVYGEVDDIMLADQYFQNGGTAFLLIDWAVFKNSDSSVNVPDHWVVYAGGLKIQDDYVEFDFWTFGRVETFRGDMEKFEDFFFATVVGMTPN